MGLSRHTIKNYLLKIFDKLGVSKRVELLFLTLSQPISTIPAVEGKRSTKPPVREPEHRGRRETEKGQHDDNGIDRRSVFAELKNQIGLQLNKGLESTDTHVPRR